jgi:hypothetical protein
MISYDRDAQDNRPSLKTPALIPEIAGVTNAKTRWDKAGH